MRIAGSFEKKYGINDAEKGAWIKRKNLETLKFQGSFWRRTWRWAAAAQLSPAALLRGRPSHGTFHASAFLSVGNRQDRSPGLFTLWVLAQSSRQHKRTSIRSSECWRRTWDSNPRGCYTLLAFQASSLATRSILHTVIYLFSFRSREQ